MPLEKRSEMIFFGSAWARLQQRSRTHELIVGEYLANINAELRFQETDSTTCLLHFLTAELHPFQ